MREQDTNPDCTVTEPIDLDAIEARAKAATPGPWSETRDGVRCRDSKIPGQTFRLFTLSSFEMAQADCAFVAAARQDVPALVAEVWRLRGENARWRACVDSAEANARSADARYLAGAGEAL